MNTKFLSLLALALIFNTSCKEDDPVVTPPVENKNVQVNLNYDFNFGNQDFALNTEYTLDNGYKVRYSLATFYLSKPVIMDDAGGMTALSPEYLIVRPDVTMSDLGFIQEGHAHMFNFSIGVDSASNTENGSTGVQPTDFSDPNHPLGTNEFRKDRSTMVHSDVLGGETINMLLAIDYKAFFNGVDLTTEILSMSMGEGRALGIKMMDQFDQAMTISKMENGNKNN